jgi:hypothetical protein
MKKKWIFLGNQGTLRLTVRWREVDNENDVSLQMQHTSDLGRRGSRATHRPLPTSFERRWLGVEQELPYQGFF